MATSVKQNGIAKNQNATLKKDVQKKLTQQAVGKPIVSVKTMETPKNEKVFVNIDDRIQRFEKLKGLATQRERLSDTLSELIKFNYNQDDSGSFYLRDSRNLEFKTTNTNLIKLVTSHLQTTLEDKKMEIEKQIIEFEL